MLQKRADFKKNCLFLMRGVEISYHHDASFAYFAYFGFAYWAINNKAPAPKPVVEPWCRSILLAVVSIKVHPTILFSYHFDTLILNQRCFKVMKNIVRCFTHRSCVLQNIQNRSIWVDAPLHFGN